MNWGTRIVLLYTGFVALILALVFGAASQDFQLVTEDYYAEELDYQQIIVASQNAKALETPLHIDQNLAEKKIVLSFPEAHREAVGEVNFYKPDNAQEDRTIVLRPVDGKQSLSLAGMRNGRWTMKVRWESSGKTFYEEQSLFIP